MDHEGGKINRAWPGLLWPLAFALSLSLMPFREVERLAAVLLCLTALAGLVFSGRDLDRRHVAASRISLCILAFWILVTLSAAWSVAPSLSLIYAGAFAVLPATILGLMIARDDVRGRFLRAAAWGTGLIVAGLSLWALIQVFILPEFLVRGQVRHPFANPNAFAALLNLALFAGLGLFLETGPGRTRIALAAGLVLAGSALAAIASQAATITCIAGLGAAFLLTRRDIPPPGFRSILWIAAAAVVMGVVMAMLPDKTDIVSRLARLGEGGVNSWQNRIDIWRGTLSLIAEHPILGTGYRTFFLMYPSVRLPSETYSGGYMAHSDPLQFWAEAGIGGLALFYAAGLMIAFRFAAWRRSGGRDILPVFLFCGCAAFIVHSHVDFLLYTMPSSMMFALALGALLIRTRSREEAEPLPFSFIAAWPAGIREAALALPVAMLLMAFIPLMLAEHYTARAQELAKNGNMGGFGGAVNAANHIGGGMAARPYVMAAAIPLGILKSNAGSMTIEEQEKLFHQIDGLLSKALSRNSRMAVAWQNRGEMIALLDPSILPGGGPSPEECFKKALSIDPLFLPARQSLAQSFLSQGQEEKALEMLSGGLRWPYPSIDPAGYYAETEALANRLNRPDIVGIVAEVRKIHSNRVRRSIAYRETLSSLSDP